VAAGDEGSRVNLGSCRIWCVALVTSWLFNLQIALAAMFFARKTSEGFKVYQHHFEIWVTYKLINLPVPSPQSSHLGESCAACGAFEGAGAADDAWHAGTSTNGGL